MPWSNQSGGPWGQKGGSGSGGNNGGGKNPWGSGGGSGGDGNQPPNFEDLLRQSQDKLKGIFGGGSGGGGGSRSGMPSFGGKGALLVVLLGVALWLLTGFYTIRPNEMGVNMIFGKYTGSTGDGLNYNLPYPIGHVLKFDVTTQQRAEIGFRSVDSNSRASDLELQRERLMLTGDENIVSVSFFVIWQIDPKAVEKYAFTLESPRETIKAVSESAMREVVGRSNIQDVLTTRREAIARSVLEIMQQTLKGYDTGILINNVQVQIAEPPEQVRPAFIDVNAAQQEASQRLYDATTYANRILPQARGEAAVTIQKAEGYKAQMIAEGTGQATYFKEVYASYKTSPAIIRERIFLETMENILKGSNKIIIDQNAQGSTGVIPFLPLTQPAAK